MLCGAGGRPDDARDENELKSDERDEFESIDGQPSVFEVERIRSCLILTDVHPRERPGR